MKYISIKIIQILSISVTNHTLLWHLYYYLCAVYTFLKKSFHHQNGIQVEMPGEKYPRSKPATREQNPRPANKTRDSRPAIIRQSRYKKQIAN